MPARHFADLAGTRRSQFRVRPDAASGPPTTGAHLIGEIHVDSLGVLWSCVIAGTPGSWQGGKRSVALGNSAGQVVDTSLATTRSSAVWDITFINATSTEYSRVSASTDLTDVTYNQSSIVAQGPSTFPVVAVDLSSGSIRLIVDTVSVGWTVFVERRHYG